MFPFSAKRKTYATSEMMVPNKSNRSLSCFHSRPTTVTTTPKPASHDHTPAAPALFLVVVDVYLGHTVRMAVAGLPGI